MNDQIYFLDGLGTYRIICTVHSVSVTIRQTDGLRIDMSVGCDCIYE
jgi:hypothetical protein